MNKVIMLASFIAGVAVGVGASYLFLKDKMQKNFDKELEEERDALESRISRLKALYAEKSADEKPKVEESEDKKEDEQVKTDYSTLSSKLGYLPEASLTREKATYPEPAPHFETYDAYKVWIRRLPGFETADIYPITEDEFVNNDENYDQEYCTWHSSRDVIDVDSSDGGVYIDVPEEIWGPDWKRFINYEKGVGYFCNRSYSTLYEVLVYDD